MAYFSNGTEGMVFEEECLSCKYGQKPCPIAFAQMNYNYDACNIPIARAILDSLVKDDGTCEIKKMFKTDFATDPAQLKIF